MTISTNQVERDDRLEFWREIARPFYSFGPLDKDRKFQAQVQTRLLGSTLVGKLQSSGRTYQRDQAHVTQSGVDGYQLKLILQGGMNSYCDSADVHLKPGDIGVFDYARPHKAQQIAGTSLALFVPRDQLDVAIGGRSAHGTVLRAGAPTNRLLSNIVHSLVDVMHDMLAEDAMATDAATLDLIAASVANKLPNHTVSDTGLHRPLQQEIHAFINANMGDADLGPSMLTAHFNISRAHLYRIFLTQGGIARIIREKRLVATYRDLQRTPGKTITEVAYEYGFSSSNQFLRAFSAYYGMTPSQARNAPTAHMAPISGIGGLTTHLPNIAPRGAT